MPFEAQKIINRNLVISTNKQNAYGTQLADAALIHRLRFDPSAFGKFAKAYRSDLQRAGKGHPWATEREKVQQSYSFSFNQEITDFIAGWIWAFVLGADNVAGGGPPYTHTITPDLSTNIAPVTTVYGEDTADVKTKHADLAINSLKVSGGPVGPAMCSVDLVGSGKYVDGAMGGAGLPALPTNAYLLGNYSDIKIGAPGALASIKERVKSWEVDYMQNVIPHYAPGGGLVASFTERGIPAIKFMMSVMAKDADDIRTLLLNDTIQAVQIIVSDSTAAKSMQIDLDHVYLSAAVKGADGDKVIWQVEIDEQSMMKNGANPVIQVTVINSVATYLVGA
jgi:hypothetical protein